MGRKKSGEYIEMSKYLQLSEGLFLFGQGGVTRVEPLDKRGSSGYSTDSEFNTVLYNNNLKITVVKNTVDEILKMLDNKLGDKDEN